VSEALGQGVAAMRRMRKTRRGRYVEQLDVMELLYRVYVGAIFGGLALAYLADVINEATASPSAVDAIRDHGPAALGVAFALAVFAGLRTGARGGPLAIEPAEVQYVLLTPIDRGKALRPAALGQLRIAAGAGAVLGAIVGNFVFRRLPGSPVEWIACLALFGALLPAGYLGAALLACGQRLRPHVATALGATLLAWSLADLAFELTSSPATMVGELGTLPLQSGAEALLAVAGLAAGLALLAVGLLGVGGVLLEAARRRAQLVAELRFSASVQDLRTVVLLRRQLASERPRRRPWARLRVGGAGRRPVWRRGWQSFLRWPLARLVRVVVLAVAAGAASVGAWEVSIALVVVPGALLLVAALDVIEPLAQEADHPTRGELLPLGAGRLYRRHVIAPAAALTAIVLLAALAAAVISRNPVALELGMVMALPTALVLALCAAFSATNDPYALILAPQLSYAQTGAPIGVAVIACGLPVGVGWAAWTHGKAAALTVFPFEVFLLAVAGVALLALERRMAKREVVPA
jgi:hypothetical protein